MVKHLRTLLIALFCVAAAGKAIAQCANDNTLTPGSLTPPGITQTTSQVYAAGQYVLAYVISGNNYTVSTCGGALWDTQITVYDDATGAFIAYNDDFCGLQTSVSFTPTFCGYVRVLLDQYFCSNSGLTTTVNMTLNSGSAGGPSLTASTDENDCPGDMVTIGLASNGAGGTPPYTYAWSPVTGLQNSLNPQTGATVSTTTTYTLTMTDANGCEAYDTVTVTANPVPVVNIGPDTTLCGYSFLLDAGNPGDSYLWNTGAGTQQLMVTQSGFYSVAVSNSFGCVGSDGAQVTINNPPPFSLGADTSQCGGTVALDAGSGFASYSWSTGDNTQMSSATATGNYSVTVSDANGCVMHDTMMVTINPAPSVNLGPDTTQCGGSVTLDAGNPGSVYFWSNSTTNQTTAATSTNTYVVQVVTLAGCTSTDSINVTINPIPQVDLGPDTAACAGSIVLDAGNPGSTYAWNNGPPTQTNTVSTNGTYIVVVTSPAGCTESDTINVTLNSNPTVNANADQFACPGDTVALSATGAQSYTWSNGIQAPSITVSPTVSTTYYVTGTDVNGCQATDVTTVYILQNTSASFTYTITGVTTQFTSTSNNATSYSWDFGDNSPVSAQQNPSHTYTANGTYTVTLTVTGPCGVVTTQQIVVINTIGIQEELPGLSMSLYPNPSSGVFNLQLELDKEQKILVEICDLRGARIWSEEQRLRSCNRQISLEGVESGMYLVRIRTEKGAVTRKLIIQ